jgi:23S rRNA-/tRNA-specific pseudouridylate synthase
MTSPKKRNAIGFPPPLLGESAFRLPIAANAKDWIALEKPAGVGIRSHPWDRTPDLDKALNRQLAEDKPELRATDADLFASIYYLEPEASGVALFAKGRDSLDRLRNACGSHLMRFRFLFVAARAGAPAAERLRSEAPLLPHYSKNKMIPSTAKGKKALTDFRRLADASTGWTLWEATSRYCRIHQVRAHAALLGIPIVGDLCYAGPAVPTLQDLLPKKRGSALSAPAFKGMAMHLLEVEIPSFEDVAGCVVRSEPPKDFLVLLKRLDLADAGIE